MTTPNAAARPRQAPVLTMLLGGAHVLCSLTWRWMSRASGWQCTLHECAWQALQMVVSVSLILQPRTGHVIFLLTVVSLCGLHQCTERAGL